MEGEGAARMRRNFAAIAMDLAARPDPFFGERAPPDEENRTQSVLYLHNAWDLFEWDDEQDEKAKKKVEEQLENPMSEEEQNKLKSCPHENWNAFYSIHNNRFFKDRHWLFTEFPELVPYSKNAQPTSRRRRAAPCLIDPKEPRKIWEIGCGSGSSAFPILKYGENDPNLFIYCSDFSSTAVQLVKEHPEYDEKRIGAFELDITDEEWMVPFEKESIDVISLIFVLSAIEPHKLDQVVKNIYKYLRPGGVVCFRDYGLYDMAQLRFKKGRCLSENFYARGDGTFVNFFTQEQVVDLFRSSGFYERDSLLDRRLQLNRAKHLQMVRIWVQARFQKPGPGVPKIVYLVGPEDD